MSKPDEQAATPPKTDPPPSEQKDDKSSDDAGKNQEAGKEDGQKGEAGKEDGQNGEGKEKSEGFHPSKKAIVIGVLVLLLVIGAGLFFYLRGRGFVSTDDAYVTGHVHPVSARVAGTVLEVLVDDNQTVAAGDLLVRLDPRDYEVALQRAEAGLAQARAQLGQQEATVGQVRAQGLAADAEVSRAQAGVAQAGAQTELAQVNFNRNRSLFQRDARAVARADVDTTSSNLDATKASLDASKAALEASRAQAEAARANLRAADAQTVVARANVSVQESEVANARLQLSYCQILAPVAGKISRRNAEAGQRLTPGQSLLAVVPENVWVLANLKETQLEKVVVGQRVDIRVDALPHQSFPGTVDSIQEGSGATFSLLPPDNATGNFTKIVQRVPVKIVFDESAVRDFKDKIVPGLSAIPKIDLNSATPGKPAVKAQKREDKRQQREEKQNREREEGKP